MRGTWPQALRTFFLPIVLVVGVRWLLIEPFVIPSGSMIPSLLVHDHIVVNKLRFGIKLPFSNTFLLHWGHPHRGDVVVFRYPENPDVFFVKRVIAVSGDRIEVLNGDLVINGEIVPQTALPRDVAVKNITFEEGFDYFLENHLDSSSTAPHVVRYQNKASSFFHSVTVPKDSFFAMGDNRDQSSDSRYWGYVPEQNLVGSATYIWLACDKTLESAAFLCDPQTIRWSRVGLKIQ
jgi:signal peptidase I